MTVPGEAALRFLWGLALGGLMGVVYEFLRPLRRRRNAPADLLFVGFSLWIWVWYSFRICAGDIRLGGTAALGLGAIALIRTLGKRLSRLFFPFWRGIFLVFAWILSPVKKIFRKTGDFLKKVFASGKKRGTIEWNKRRHFRRTFGGHRNEQPSNKAGPA